MTFTESIRTCFNKYATIKGTASRSEYWWFYLFCFLGVLVLSMVSDAASVIFALGTMIPSITVGIRRLHDTDHSGWLMLLCLVPIIGYLILMVFMILRTSPNRYADSTGENGTVPTVTTSAPSVSSDPGSNQS